MRRGGDQHIPRPPQWRPGHQPPWSGRDLLPLDEVLQLIADRGPGAPPEVIDSSTTMRASAVLVGLYPGSLGPEVILTKRTAHLSSHRGEISFPGGRCDDGESAAEAAVREAHEEVGLAPELPMVVGQLDHLATVVSRSAIVPVVATIEERPALVANPAEVDRILHVPLAELVAPDVWHSEWWTFAGRERSMAFFDLPGETVWGATARILTQLLTIATGATDEE